MNNTSILLLSLLTDDKSEIEKINKIFDYYGIGKYNTLDDKIENLKEKLYTENI